MCALLTFNLLFQMYVLYVQLFKNKQILDQKI